MDGIHLCTTRLKLLRLNTMRALQRTAVADADRLKQLTQEKLRSLGRLPFPMVRRRGEKGFSRVSWDEALSLVAGAIHRTAPQRMGFFATSSGLTNVVYYVYQILARTPVTNHVAIGSHLARS